MLSKALNRCQAPILDRATMDPSHLYKEIMEKKVETTKGVRVWGLLPGA